MEKTTSASSTTISPTFGMPCHANEQLIDIDGLSVKFGSELVLSNVSMCVHQGEFIGVIGPNGAGKTTLLKVILGLLKPQTGKVSKVKGQVAYIPQHLLGRDWQVPISVLEVVKLGSQRGAPAALKEIGLENITAKRFSELSGGQQQRVLIAKALASKPSILILDEPTTGIDEQAQTEFYSTLRHLQETGMTIIMVSHDIDTVLRLVTRVVCINVGVLYDGPPEHFEADKYLPNFYTNQHRLLHHHHGVKHA